MKVEGTPGQSRTRPGDRRQFCSAGHTKTDTLTGGVDIGEHFSGQCRLLISNLTRLARHASASTSMVMNSASRCVSADGRMSDDDLRALYEYLARLFQELMSCIAGWNPQTLS